MKKLPPIPSIRPHITVQPFETSQAELDALSTPSAEELARATAKWRERVSGPLSGLIDAGEAALVET